MLTTTPQAARHMTVLLSGKFGIQSNGKMVSRPSQVHTLVSQNNVPIYQYHKFPRVKTTGKRPHTTKARDKIDSHHNQDTFYRTREIAEKQDTGVVLLPRRQIKVGEREDLRHDSPP